MTWVASLLSAATVFAFAVATAQTTAPGRLADLNGQRLHVHCSGAGGPAVVIETGLGDTAADWKGVQDRVSRHARVCTYDRGGYGFSDPGPMPRTFAQLNLELHEALQQLGERGPFVLLGHSYGGGVARNYALLYPKDVAGLMLADSVHEDQQIQMGPQLGRIRDGAKGHAVPPPRLSGPTKPPPGAAPLEFAENSQMEWSSESFALWHATPQRGVLGALPLLVVMRDKGGYPDGTGVPAAALEADRIRLQGELATLSTNGSTRTLACGHNMQSECPDALAAVIRQFLGGLGPGPSGR